MSELIDDLDRYLAGEHVRSESSEWFRKKVGAPAPRPSETASDPDVRAVLEAASDIAGWDANLYRSSTLTKAYTQLDSILGRLDTLLKARPDFALARFWRGVALLRRGRLEEAHTEMERSIDRVGELARAHFEFGRLNLALYLVAERRARKHLSPAGVNHHLAELHGRLEPVAAAFREARRLQEDLAPWQLDFARAVEQLTRNEFGGCVSLCDGILTKDPDLDEVWKLRGDALRLAGREPFDSYDRAVQIRRTFYEALLAKAEACLERGGTAEARACLERVLEIRPGLIDAVALMARTYLLDGAHESALALLRESLERDPSHYEAVVTHAELLVELGELETALLTLDRAGQLKGCMNRVNLLRARTLLMRVRRAKERGGDPRADLQAIEGMAGFALSHEPENEPWLSLLGEARRAALAS
jgi:tetratricopeptide (TPR) repeat protein